MIDAPLTTFQQPLLSHLASNDLAASATGGMAGWPGPALAAFAHRNAALDGIFYDIGTVMPEEVKQLQPWLAREGALLIVPPSGKGILTPCDGIEQFAQAGGTEVRILVVAGVGSSALGAAAFARNVADAFDMPVAALVSGYGLSDLLSEAIGGFFWFRGVNKARYVFERLHESLRAMVGDERNFQMSGVAANLARESSDTKVLVSVLSDKRFSFSLLAGHSKGNFVISEALYELATTTDERLRMTQIVTVSAVVPMPPRFVDRISNVIGQLDWFGGFNSVAALGLASRVPGAWHHTNTKLCYHLPVTKVFQELRATRGLLQ